jgi:hypothetical protein
MQVAMRVIFGLRSGGKNLVRNFPEEEIFSLRRLVNPEFFT